MWDYFEDLDNYLCRRKTATDEYTEFDDYIPNLKPSCLEGCIIKEASVQDKKGIIFSQRPIIEEKGKKIKYRIIKTKESIVAKIKSR